jgi:negative regulator of genetic competence, sporulation and motility
MLTVATYKTKGGDDVKIVAIEDGIAIGYVLKQGANAATAWRADNGRYYLDDDFDHRYDIIDSKPRIRMEKWATLYYETDGAYYIDLHNSLSDAKSVDSDGKVAITKIIIDCTEGANLD